MTVTTPTLTHPEKQWFPVAEHAALFVTTVSITLEAFLAPFAEHFRAAGWRIDALSNGATTNPHIADSFDARFDVEWSRNPLDPRNLIGSASRVRDVVAGGNYDIVHVHTPIAAFVTRFALRSIPRRPSIIYTAHGFHFYEGQASAPHAVYRTMERRAARWTDYLVTINAEDFSAARDLGTIPPERVRLIPGIGVDTGLFRPTASADTAAAQAVRAGLDVRADDFMLTMVAEFGAVKRHAHLFEALARVHDPRIVVVLVGTGPLESQLREKALALGIGNRLRWAGYRRDVPEVMRASDALVLCSEREGLNRSVLEAMASGLPVIGTRTRGIADAITAETGWLVAKHDVAALAAAIETAAADPAALRAKGTAARRVAEERYALPSIITAYEELYLEALASRV